MATRPQFDDSERLPKEIKTEPELSAASGRLTKEELQALRDFLFLLDEWDRKNKSRGKQ